MTQMYKNIQLNPFGKDHSFRLLKMQPWDQDTSQRISCSGSILQWGSHWTGRIVAFGHWHFVSCACQMLSKIRTYFRSGPVPIRTGLTGLWSDNVVSFVWVNGRKIWPLKHLMGFGSFTLNESQSERVTAKSTRPDGISLAQISSFNNIIN